MSRWFTPRILILAAGIVLSAAAICVFNARTSAPTTTEPSVVGSLDSTALMNALLSDNREQAQQALLQLKASGDKRFVAPLVELLGAVELGLVRNVTEAEIVLTLERLSGQHLGKDWPSWVEWYGSSDLQPGPGFTGWKGQLLSGVDRRFGEFLREGLPTRIRVEEIVWGGVRVDGIPALDSPAFIAADAATYLQPQEPVFGVSINGDQRAYPLRILDWHEMANDVVGGVPISLAY